MFDSHRLLKHLEVADKARLEKKKKHRSEVLRVFDLPVCDGASVTIISAFQTSYQHPAGYFNWQVTYCNK